MAKNAVTKSDELINVQVSFVSLVKRAANRRTFLIAKGEDKSLKVHFPVGRIIKAETDASDGKHYITGVVYEPLVADTDDEFMTAKEIRKAAYWFSENAGRVDIQHNFVPVEGVVVVENWVTKGVETVAGEEFQEGTWLLTVRVDNEEVWSAVEKGNLNGFSLGGLAQYGETDVNVDEIAQQAQDDGGEEGVAKAEADKRAVAVKVEKGELADQYHEGEPGKRMCWLLDLLYRNLIMWDWSTDNPMIRPGDAAGVQEIIADFVMVSAEILGEGDVGVTKMVDAAKEYAAELKTKAVKVEKTEQPQKVTDKIVSVLKGLGFIKDKGQSVEKAGAKISSANRDKIQSALDGAKAAQEKAQGAVDALQGLLDDTTVEDTTKTEKTPGEQAHEEVVDVNKEETEAIVQAEVAKIIPAIVKAMKEAQTPAAGEETPPAVPETPPAVPGAPAAPAAPPAAPEPTDIAKMIAEEVKKQMKGDTRPAPAPNNLNADPNNTIQKNENVPGYIQALLPG